MSLQNVIDSISAGEKQTYTKEELLFILNESGLEEKPKQESQFRTISCVVKIGKSKKEINYTFLAKDFNSATNNTIHLINENRELKVDDENLKKVIEQLNNF